jgi:hypothetical protein
MPPALGVQASSVDVSPAFLLLVTVLRRLRNFRLCGSVYAQFTGYHLDRGPVEWIFAEWYAAALHQPRNCASGSRMVKES